MVGHFSAVAPKADDKSFAFKLQFIISEDENKKNPVLYISVFAFIHNIHHNLEAVISTPLLGFFPTLEFINNHCKTGKGVGRLHVVCQLWFLSSSFHLQDDCMFML